MECPDIRSSKEHLWWAVREARRAENDIQYGNLLEACNGIEAAITHVLTAYKGLFKESMEGTGSKLEAAHQKAHFSSPEALSHA